MRRHPFIFTLQWTSFAHSRAGMFQIRTVSGHTERLPHYHSRAHSISSSSLSSRKTNLSCIWFASRRALKSSLTLPTVWSWNNWGKHQCRSKGHCISNWQISLIMITCHCKATNTLRFQLWTNYMTKLSEISAASYPFQEISMLFFLKHKVEIPLAANTAMERLHDLWFEDIF